MQKNHSKRHFLSEGYFSAIYVIIKLPPPSPWVFPLQTLPPDIQPLTRPSHVRTPSYLLLVLVPWWWWLSSPTPLPAPSSVSTYKEGSNRAGDQEEGFVSRKYSKSGAGYLIQSMVILKTYLWGQGCGYKKKDLKHQEMKCDGWQK